MDAYKVWSMSCDKRQCNYRLEYETRVSASSSDEALKMAKRRHRQPLAESEGRAVNWMVTKLP